MDTRRTVSTLSIEEVASYLVIGIGEPIGTEFHFSSQAGTQSYHDVLESRRPPVRRVVEV